MSEADRIRAAYAERDAAPMTVYGYDNPGYQFHMQDLEWQVTAALRRAGIRLQGVSVLEVGSGFGHNLHRLTDLGAAQGTGIDLSESRVEEARRRYPGLHLVTGDASSLPFEDGSFDLVTQYVCLSSVLDANVRAAIAQEMWRVTKPGGAVLSYDIRPTPRAIQAAGRAMHALRGTAAPDGGTPTVPIPEGELRGYFPVEPEIRDVTLNFELATAVAGRSAALARALKAVPLLRTHHLALARKPVQ